VPVLVDHRDVVVVVHRRDGDRAVVLDDLSGGDVATRHPNLVPAQRENVSAVQGFRRYRLEYVLSHE
jgi:hypothetical protein